MNKVVKNGLRMRARASECGPIEAPDNGEHRRNDKDDQDSDRPPHLIIDVNDNS